MKVDIGALIRNYVEGDLEAERLDKSIATSRPVQYPKRGQSAWLPSGDALEGMKFGYAELSRLHDDLKAKKLGVESALLVIDMITMNRDVLVDGGSAFVDEIDGIGTPEDLVVWREQAPFSG